MKDQGAGDDYPVIKLTEDEIKEIKERKEAIEWYRGADIEKENAELREIIAELIPMADLGDLPQRCVLGCDEVKFCRIRQGDGNGCQYCDNRKEVIERARKLSKPE